MCITRQIDRHILLQGGTTQKYFPMNEPLLLLIYLAKTVINLSQAAMKLVMKY